MDASSNDPPNKKNADAKVPEVLESKVDMSSSHSSSSSCNVAENRQGQPSHEEAPSHDANKMMPSSGDDRHCILVSKVHGYNNAGLVCFRNFDFHKALQLHRRALKWIEKRGNNRAAESSSSSRDREEGSHRPSAKESSSTKEEKEEVAVLSHITLNHIANCFVARNELDEARNCYQRSISYLVKPPLSLSFDDPDVQLARHKLRASKDLERALGRAMDDLHANGKNDELHGKYDKAIGVYVQSLNELVRIIGNRIHPCVATTLHKIGVMHWKRGKYNAALQFLSESLRTFTKCFDDQHENVAEVLSSIGMVHLARGDYEAAMKFYQTAFKLQKNALGENHPDVARILIRIGMVYDERGRHDKAMKLFRHGLDMQRRALAAAAEEESSFCTTTTTTGAGERSCEQRAEMVNNGESQEVKSLQIDVAATLNSMGVVHERSGEYTSAMRAYEEALTMYRNALEGDNHVDVAITLNNMGQIYRIMGNFSKAMDAYQRALKIMRACLGNSHRNVATTLHNIALLHSKQRKFDAALQLYREVLEVQRQALGEQHPDVAVTLQNMGEVYERKGDAGPPAPAHDNDTCSDAKEYRRSKYKKAGRLYSKALAVRRASLGGEHYYVALTLHQVGVFYASKAKDYAKSQKLLEEALRIYRVNKIDEDSPQVVEALEWSRKLHSSLNKKQQRQQQQQASRLHQQQSFSISWTSDSGASSKEDNISRSSVPLQEMVARK